MRIEGFEKIEVLKKIVKIEKSQIIEKKLLLDCFFSDDIFTRVYLYNGRELYIETHNLKSMKVAIKNENFENFSLGKKLENLEDFELEVFFLIAVWDSKLKKILILTSEGLLTIDTSLKIEYFEIPEL